MCCSYSIIGIGADPYIKLTVNNYDTSAGYQDLTNLTPVKLTLSEFSKLTNSILQDQGTTLNSSPIVFNSNLINGDYTYTSSLFSTEGTIPNSNDAIGTTQFGLCTNYGYFVKYLVSYDNADPVEKPSCKSKVLGTKSLVLLEKLTVIDSSPGSALS